MKAINHLKINQQELHKPLSCRHPTTKAEELGWVRHERCLSQQYSVPRTCDPPTIALAKYFETNFIKHFKRYIQQL